MVYQGGAAQAKVTLNRHSTKAEGGNQKAPANQEQMDCRSAAGAHTDLQAGRGTHAEDEHRAVGSYSHLCPREHTTAYSQGT